MRFLNVLQCIFFSHCFMLIACNVPRFMKYKVNDGVSKYEYDTKYIRMEIDHFAFPNPGFYQMRYLVSDKYWNKTSGPIFFYTGNEGDVTAFAENTGFVWDIAPQFQARIVFAEHRYYGKSMPYGNDSYKDPEHRRYFTSEQALADYAVLLRDINADRRPVILFGGSYGGMLAAWMRIKYPHLVDGAIAGSAPIWQFPGYTACGVFNKIVSRDFMGANRNCARNIRRTWDTINKFGQDDAGRKLMSESLSLCKPLTSAVNITTLKNWLVNVYGNLAMVNYPYPTSFLEPLPAWPVKAFCSHLTEPLKDKELLIALKNGLNVYFNHTGTTKCLDITSQDAGGLNDEGWDYQACTEMVMPMCSDGVNDMFEPTKWDIKAYSEGCFNRWGVKPDADWIITHYGDRHLTASSNIVFSNGDLDPWSGGGVLTSLSPTLPAITIPYAAHHLDLRGKNPSDTVYVRYARRKHVSYITQWIREHREDNPPNNSDRTLIYV